MSEFETEEMREAARSRLSGLLIHLHPAPPHADEIVTATQDLADFAEQFVELKVSQLSDGILERVRSEVQRILQEHLRAQPATTSSHEGLMEHFRRVSELDDEVLLREFTARVTCNAYSAKELRRLNALLNLIYEHE